MNVLQIMGKELRGIELNNLQIPTTKSVSPAGSSGSSSRLSNQNKKIA